MLITRTVTLLGPWTILLKMSKLELEMKMDTTDVCVRKCPVNVGKGGCFRED